MPPHNNTPNLQNDKYWLQMDELFELAEKKNLLTAINRSDTEKFYQFTTMLRVANTLSKIKVLEKK